MLGREGDVTPASEAQSTTFVSSVRDDTIRPNEEEEKMTLSRETPHRLSGIASSATAIPNPFG